MGLTTTAAMQRSVANILRSLIAIVIGISLMAVGFSHRGAPAELSPELAAYVAAGGSLSDICGNTDGDGPVHIVDCEACRITDTMVTLRNCNHTLTTIIQRTETFRFIAKRLAQSQGLDPARLTRAPPQA